MDYYLLCERSCVVTSKITPAEGGVSFAFSLYLANPVPPSSPLSLLINTSHSSSPFPGIFAGSTQTVQYVSHIKKNFSWFHFLLRLLPTCSFWKVIMSTVFSDPLYLHLCPFMLESAPRGFSSTALLSLFLLRS